MKKTLLSLLVAGALCGQMHASEITQDTAIRFMTTFYQAMQKHDLMTVRGMIDDRVAIKMVWTQADPPQAFTLSKADFLQQLKATWHFASDEHYEIKNPSVKTVNGVTVVTLQETEIRMLFGNKAGQHNDMKITLSGDNDNPRISTISSKTELW
jgi:hypothetical protein